MYLKLLKYEMKAMSRVLLPLYAVWAVMSALTFYMTLQEFTTNEYITIPIMVSFFALAVSIIATIIMVILRFKNNLLNTEGYIMNTLPVTAEQNLRAKLSAAVIYSLLAYILCGILWFSMMYLAYTRDSDVAEALNMLKNFFSAAAIAGIALSTVAMLAAGILKFYVALCLGHYYSNNHKIACSFVAYIVIDIIIDIAHSILYPVFIKDSNFSQNIIQKNFLDIFNTMSLYSLIEGVVLTVVLYVIAVYLLKNKLNLQAD